jgi:hypothetical protein
MRRAAASTLRSLADRFDAGRQTRTRPSVAPLIRLGGRWWGRDELVGAQTAEPDAPPPS